MAQGDEDERERVNRELIELLNELRVALPGVQVLFAFLLTVPFSQGFHQVTRAQRGVYYGAFVSAALATALLIAPSSYHRIHFRRRDKERMLLTSNKLAISGMAFLALSVAGVVYPDLRRPVPRGGGVRDDVGDRGELRLVLVRVAALQEESSRLTTRSVTAGAL